ncbi:hypothetical protein WICPIJ_002552 [Wickerhamomyces pijperi]|uniref:Uncharacterized protein n=1 Tax=Wickerhamomyces pijperi TaxID=599730 RepID=A0A9P8TPQ2_WICPI|nr:hypothetical protein WICPIJ_002552 [Wickerhamomyces pijperi]
MKLSTTNWSVSLDDFQVVKSLTLDSGVSFLAPEAFFKGENSSDLSTSRQPNLRNSMSLKTSKINCSNLIPFGSVGLINPPLTVSKYGIFLKAMWNGK